MAFDFPSSPSVGQTYTAHGQSYSYNGFAWKPKGEVAIEDAPLSDGDYGDVVITGGVWQIDPAVITTTARTVLDDTTIPAMRTTLGLGNVNNTSDLDKPISTATQAAIDAIEIPSGEDKVAKAGDVMTGGLTIQRTNAAAGVQLQNLGTVEHAGLIGFMRGTAYRWQIGSMPDTDNLAFYSYNNSGGFIGPAMVINRLTGKVTANYDLGVAGAITAASLVTSGNITGNLLTATGSIIYLNAAATQYYLWDGTYHTFSGPIVAAGGVRVNGPLTLATTGSFSGDITAGTITMNGEFGSQSIFPRVTAVYYCGTPSNRWHSGYAANGWFSTTGGGPGLRVAPLISDTALLLAAEAVPIISYTDEAQLREDEALIHVGVTPEDLEASFIAQGLNAEDYNFYHKDGEDVSINYVELLLMQVRALQERVKSLEARMPEAQVPQ